jgi:peptidyl-prolyl cis-trans isomerase B (cyclophilin B)
MIHLFALGCGGDPTPGSDSGQPNNTELAAPAGDTADVDRTDGGTAKPQEKAPFPIVTVDTNFGTFEITLDIENAPMTVDNFLYNYVQRKCYDNTIMHYSTNDIVMAGGYQADLTEIAPRAPVRNESDNGLTNEIGTVAMSRSPEYPHSATSQFFVNLGKNSVFDYEADAEEDKKWGYTVFGKVTSGLDVIERIARQPTHNTEAMENTPAEPVIIRSIRRRR